MSADGALAQRPAEPFRGAEEFRFLDRAIFHARQEETLVLLQKVTIYRGVLLYGDSGAGKSSLVNAGLIPAAQEQGLKVVRVRVQAIAGSEIAVEPVPLGATGPPFLASDFMGPDAASRVPMSAKDFEQRASAVRQPHLLMFDQFEEIVTRFIGPDSNPLRNAIMEVLLRLYYSEAAPLNLLLVFREEYLAKMADLLVLAPSWISQSFWLRPPLKTLAEDIIRAPFDPDRISPPFAPPFSDVTIKTLAEQLVVEPKDSDRLSLTDLQIACLQLWHSGSPYVLSPRGARGLIEDYLDGQLRAFGAKREMAEALVSLMITKEGTRKVVVNSDLPDQLPASLKKREADIQDVLDQLVQHTRLLRRNYYRGEETYEIVSEFLVPWIRQLRQQRDEQKLRARYFTYARIAVEIIFVIAVAVISSIIIRYELTSGSQAYEAQVGAARAQAQTQVAKAQTQTFKAVAKAMASSGTPPPVPHVSEPRHKEKYQEVLEGIEKLVSGIAPGAVYARPDQWDVLVSGVSPESAFVVARQYHRGRVAAVGHEWLLVYPQFFDNARFVENLIVWLKNKRSGMVLYTTGHREWFNRQNSQALGEKLSKSEIKIEPLGTISGSELSRASVLIIGNAWAGFSPDEISATKQYVEEGGGLLVAGLGWSWAAYNMDKAQPERTMEKYPMAQIAAPYGVSWPISIIIDPSPKYSFKDPPKGLEAQFNGAPIFHTFFPNAR